MKKVVASVCLAFTVFTTSSISANADVIGGWSEDQGYYVNNEFNISDTISPRAAKAKHKAYKETKVMGSQLYERVIAETTWKGVRHYSRARYETWVSKKPEADSGRVYNTNFTKAISGWHPGDFATAKTYYGK